MSDQSDKDIVSVALDSSHQEYLERGFRDINELYIALNAANRAILMGRPRIAKLLMIYIFNKLEKKRYKNRKEQIKHDRSRRQRRQR